MKYFRAFVWSLLVFGLSFAMLRPAFGAEMMTIHPKTVSASAVQKKVIRKGKVLAHRLSTRAIRISARAMNLKRQVAGSRMMAPLPQTYGSGSAAAVSGSSSSAN